MRLFGIALLASAASLAAAAPSRDAGVARVQTAMEQLPLRFEANLGQWNPAVRYAAHAQQYSLLFTAAGPSLEFGGRRRVDIALDNANRAPEIEALGPVSGRTNYFVGSRERWRTGVPIYSRVRYRAVYPGIDVVYYGSGGHLEYDFLVEPGADPGLIRLRFQGADRAAVTPQGDLLVECAAGRLVQKRPFVYQQDPRAGRRRIQGRYVPLPDGAVGLRLDGYDRSQPLVIDPLLIYSSYFGGAAADQINAAKVTSQGLLYVVGRTLTSDLASSDTAYEAANTASGTSDLFIMVLDTTAAGNFSVQYLSYLGGTGDDTPASMVMDSTGNLYIAGTTNSIDFPMAGASVQTTGSSTTNNVFVAEFNPALTGADALIYSTYLGGSNQNYANGIAIDQVGLIYVIGTTTSTDLPVTDSAYSGVLSGAQDAFLCEIDPSSPSLVYSSYLGGSGTDSGEAIAVSPSGLTYFAITTDSTDFPLSIAPYRTALQGVEDAVIGIVDTTQSGSNSLVYDTYFGGSDLDEVRKLAFDANGRLLLTGFTLSPDFPVTQDAVQKTLAGNGDVFVSVVDPLRPEAFLVYSTYLGGSQGDVGYDVAGDAAGSIYVVGYTLSPDFPVTFDAPQPLWGQGIDIFVAKLKPGVSGTGGLQFSTYLGGLGLRVATCLTLGADGTLYVGGYSNLGLPSGGATPAIAANTNIYAGGYSDGFILALSDVAGQPLGSNRRVVRRMPRR